MANHVNNYLDLRTVSDEGRKLWEEFFVEKMNNSQLSHFDLREFFFKVDEDGNWINYDWDLVGEKVGAKWATLEDVHEFGLNVTSAWSAIIPFAQYVAEKIGEVDPDVELVLTYEDEFPNFVGVATFTADGLDTNNEYEWEEVRERILNDHEEIRELWDAEEEDWHEGMEDEGYDLMSEVQWDVINDLQHDGIEWSNK